MANGTAMYNSVAIRATSKDVLSGFAFGRILIFSIANNATEGRNIGIANMYLETAVWTIAVLAHAYDFPKDFMFSSNTSIPEFNSLFLMNNALSAPAVEQAKKLLIEL